MKKLKYVFTIILIGLLSGCSEDFLELSNPNQLTANSFYQNEDQAISSVNSAYAVLQHMNLYRFHMWFMYAGMSDDIGWIETETADDGAMAGYFWTAEIGRCNLMWRTLYTGVSRTNQVIKNVGEMEVFELQNRVLAEARFLRAWYYRELVTGWGAVPKITEPLEGAQLEYNFPRATVAEINDLIEQDLKFAEEHLPLKSEYDGSNLGRATSGAASAYLGKSYLFQEEWSKAAEQFEKVIGTDEYGLTEFYADNFSAVNENNIESVFEVQFSADGSAVWNDDDSPVTNETHLLNVYMYNWWAVGAMYMWQRNQQFGPAWAGRGPRYSSTFDGEEARPIKYVEYNTGDARRSDVNLRDMRYADVILMYAEALNEEGRTSDAIVEIDKVIDRVRQESGLADPEDWTDIKELQTVQQLLDDEENAGWPFYFSDDQDGIRSVIKHQRRIEFMYEQKRFRDLVRWGDAPDAIVNEDDDGNVTPKFIEGKHELFPIPAYEISGNSGISNSDQNPGY